MKPNFEQLETLPPHALREQLHMIQEELSVYEQKKPIKRDLLSPVDKDCRDTIHRMLQEKRFEPYQLQLRNIIDKIDDILILENRRNPLSGITAFNLKSTLQRNNKSAANKIGGFNLSMLKKAQQFHSSQASDNQDDNDAFNEEQPSTPIQPTYQSLEIPKYTQQSMETELDTNQSMHTFISQSAGNQILERRLALTGSPNESNIKKSIITLLTELTAAKHNTQPQIIGRLETSLNHYVTFLENEEEDDDVDSIFSDDTDGEEERSINESAIFKDKKNQFITALRKAHSNSEYHTIIKSFVDDNNNPLHIKFKPERKRISIPGTIASHFEKLFQNAQRMSPLTSSEGSPNLSSINDSDTEESKSPSSSRHPSPPTLIINAIRKPFQEVTSFVMSKKPSASTVKSKSRAKSNKKGSTFAAFRTQITPITFELPKSTPQLDKDIYRELFNELIALKRQIKSAFDTKHRMSKNSAENAKTLLMNYQYKLNTLNNKPLSKSQKRELEPHDSPQFMQQLNQWMQQVEQIITPEQKKQNEQQQLIEQRKKMAVAFKKAARHVLESNESNIDLVLQQYDDSKKSLLKVLKELHKEPKPALIQIFERVNAHIAQLQKQRIEATVEVAYRKVEEMSDMEKLASILQTPLQQELNNALDDMTTGNNKASSFQEQLTHLNAVIEEDSLLRPVLKAVQDIDASNGVSEILCVSQHQDHTHQATIIQVEDISHDLKETVTQVLSENNDLTHTERQITLSHQVGIKETQQHTKQRVTQTAHAHKAHKQSRSSATLSFLATLHQTESSAHLPMTEYSYELKSSLQAKPLDKDKILSIITQSEELSLAFEKKIVQLKTKPKMIQYGTHQDKFMVVAYAADNLQLKLKKARDTFLETHDLNQYNNNCHAAFSDSWTKEVFETSRTNPWIKPFASLLNYFKRSLYHFLDISLFTLNRKSDLIAQGTFFKPFTVGTETAQKAQEYESGLQDIINKNKGS